MIEVPQKTPAYDTITVEPLHDTFGAEVQGIDWKNISDKQFQEILHAASQYGICVFRNTGLDDDSHVQFSERFGELDNIRRYIPPGQKSRFKYDELFDAGNLDADGQIIDPKSDKAQFGKGNQLFHVDSSFQPRRASYCLLLAHQLPPPDTGGATEFADTRTAFDELPSDLKNELLEKDYVAAHTLSHSRKTAAPEFFNDLDPSKTNMFLHKVAQKHEESSRMNLYIAAHAHHIEGVSTQKSADLLSYLMHHATQPKYVLKVSWQQPGDLVIWDNRTVMHRATGGAFAGKYKRDLRRTTVHDSGKEAWGLNPTDTPFEGFSVIR